MSQKPALIGIDPVTRRCEVAGINTDENAIEIRKEGFIAVPCELETASQLYGELVPDIYAVANEGAV